MYYTEDEQVIVFTKDENVKMTFRFLCKKFPETVHILTSTSMLEQYKLPNTIFIDCKFFSEKQRTKRLINLLKSEYPRVPIILIIDEQVANCIGDFLLSGIYSVMEQPLKTKIVEAVICANLNSFRDKSTQKEYHGISLDAENSSLIYNGCKLKLTKSELYIMDILLSEKYPISASCLTQILKRDLERDMCESYVRVTVSRLRKKIKEITDLDIIGTKNRDGYYIKI